MASELPDFDESVSFIVDNGASVGPLPMREIVASVASGQRSGASLIWWAGATDWCRFDSIPQLVAMSDAPTEAPSPASSPAEEPSRWDSVSEAPTQANDPAAIEAEEPSAEATPNEVVSPEALEVEPLEPVYAVVEPQHAAPEPEVVAEVEAASTADITENEAATALVTREPSALAEEADTPRPALTGLFSSGARAEQSEAAAPSPDALDAILAARSSLESVGARIEALSSATRSSMAPDEFQAGLDEFEATAAADNEQIPVAEAPTALAPTEITAVEPDEASGSWTSVEGTEQDAVPVAADGAATNNRAQLNERFEEMVRKSVDHQRRIEWIHASR